ncbi:MAG TPA: hypothetical protein VEG44_01020 [Candidatus Acidoferrales bacterium]|nr:hypothetical protein [Candidatus Acidoferrales bacterium]
MATALNSTPNNLDVNSTINLIKPFLPYLGPLGGAAVSFASGVAGAGIFLLNSLVLSGAAALALGFSAGTLIVSIPALISAVPVLLAFLPKPF